MSRAGSDDRKAKQPRREREQLPTSDPNLSVVICDDGSRTLKCHRRGITWHSESGAVAESQLVFVDNGGVAEIFANRVPARVLEIGFGTGLNFWLTASLALELGATLEYVSLEPNPLNQEMIDSLQYSEIGTCRRAIEAFSIHAGRQRVADVELVLLKEQFQSFDWSPDRNRFDVVYHDPFSPEAAPELWERDVFEKLFAMLKPGGRLVTYCVKSEIRRRLADVGFDVSKTRGPVGGKREVLVARKRLGTTS